MDTLQIAPNLDRLARFGLFALIGAVGFVAVGCFVDVTNDGDGLPPAAPRGVTSISGDGEVTILWYPNQEPDLDGYEVWRSRNPDTGYRKIAVVSPNITEFTDTDVQNGETYYYAVLAFDEDGNESELSPEIVEDTPRPEGYGVTLINYEIDPQRSGFTFSSADIGPRNWDRDGDGVLDRDVDIFFGFDDVVNIAYFYSDHEDLFMQDLGYHERMDEVDVAPTKGYTIISVEALEGHVYAFFTPDGHYAKVRVTRVSDESVTFDWAYQLQRENPDLAPPFDPATVTRGPERRR